MIIVININNYMHCFGNSLYIIIIVALEHRTWYKMLAFYDLSSN